MRAVRLVHVAVEAETIRWKSMASRIVTRLAFAVVALLFIIGVVVFAHIAAWFWLRTDMQQNVYVTAAALGGVDLLIAIALGFLATRSSPSPAEQEALEIRRRAVQNIRTSLTIGQMAVPMLRLTNSLIRRARA